MFPSRWHIEYWLNQCKTPNLKSRFYTVLQLYRAATWWDGHAIIIKIKLSINDPDKRHHSRLVSIHHVEDTTEEYSHSSQPSSERQVSQTELPLGQPETSLLDEPEPESKALENNTSQELKELREAFEAFKATAARDLEKAVEYFKGEQEITSGKMACQSGK